MVLYKYRKTLMIAVMSRFIRKEFFLEICEAFFFLMFDDYVFSLIHAFNSKLNHTPQKLNSQKMNTGSVLTRFVNFKLTE